MFRKSSQNNNASMSSHSDTTENNPTAKKSSTPPTIIASDVSILGTLISEGVVDLGGRVDGIVKGSQITVRQTGAVKGDVIGEVVHVYGEVKGIVKAKTVVLFSSCRIEGIIMHESLTIEDGAFVDGKFKRTDRATVAEDSLEETFADTLTPLGESDARNFKLLENLKLVSG